MANTTIQIRTDSEVKYAADIIFNNLGITMSDGINIFLRQVNLYGGFPFEVKLPNFDQNTQNSLRKKENIHSLCGKYKNSVFSTQKYHEQKRRDKVLEK